MGKTISAVIKWFDNQKGIGFAKPILNGEVDHEHGDIFIHHLNISKKHLKGNGFIVVHAGEAIECVVEKTDKGLKGVDVKLTRHQFP